MKRILGIETSCDETAAAVIGVESGQVQVFSNVVSSQMEIHARYGGVVPEVAARQHIKNIIPVIDQALSKAQLSLGEIDLVAATLGPGLIGSLMVGWETAKTLAWAQNLPLVPVNHLVGHLWSWLLPGEGEKKDIEVPFPYLSLIVSGGHTELVLVNSFFDWQILGRTVDDAAGEAFDKVAKLLGLGYPGGPALSKLAQSGKTDEFSLPRPMLNSGDFNFSFSGLKTAVLYLYQKLESNLTSEKLADLAASFEAAVVDTLSAKMEQAIDKYQVKMISVVGGVSANQRLRRQLSDLAKIKNVSLEMPQLRYTGDNAAMIALAGYFDRENYQNKQKLLSLSPDPNLPIK